MEVVEVSGQPGKFEVLFNGQVIPCKDARDCPMGGLCAINTTWQADPSKGMCFCNAYFGFTGENCDEFSNVTAYIFIVAIIAGCICLVSFVWGAVLLLRYLALRSMLVTIVGEEVALDPTLRTRQEGLESKLCMNPVVIGLAFASLGGFFFVIGTALYLAGICLFPSRPAYLVENDRLLKAIPLNIDTSAVVMTALGYSFTVCSAAVLLLSWLDMMETDVSIVMNQVTRRSMRVRSARGARLIAFISLVFAVAILCVELPISAMIVKNTRSVESIAWYKATAIGEIIIFGALILLGVFTLRQVYKFKNALTDSQDAATQQSPSAMRGMLARITYALIGFLIALVGAFICLGICPLVFSKRVYATDPRVTLNHPQNAIRFGRVFIAALGLIGVWFSVVPVKSAQSAVREARRRLSRSKTRNSRSLSSNQSKRSEGHRTRNARITANKARSPPIETGKMTLAGPIETVEEQSSRAEASSSGRRMLESSVKLPLEDSAETSSGASTVNVPSDRQVTGSYVSSKRDEESK